MTAGLRVVHVNNADQGHGGAALAASRLHRSLLDLGVQSSMRVASKSSGEVLVKQLPQWPRFQKGAGYIMRRVGMNDLVALTAYGLTHLPDVASADVLHFHLLEGNHFSYPALVPITRSKPTVMTLHDMWPLTGHCSFSYGCDRWVSGCGKCPHLDVYPIVKRDGTHLEWRLKHWTYRHSNLAVVAPSRWMANLVGQSMLNRFGVQVIPHGIDTDLFAPRDKASCRRALGLPLDGVIIAAVSAAFDDVRKGPDLLLQALQLLPAAQRPRCVVAIMGTRGRDLAERLQAAGFRVTDLDYIWSETLKATVYSAADIFVLPTRADNASLVLLESLACGTPVASFDVGGVAETIKDGETGLIAPPEDAGALSAAIARLVDDPELRSRLGDAGRQLIVQEHTSELAARRHRELYEEVARSWGQG